MAIQAIFQDAKRTCDVHFASCSVAEATEHGRASLPRAGTLNFSRCPDPAVDANGREGEGGRHTGFWSNRGHGRRSAPRSIWFGKAIASFIHAFASNASSVGVDVLWRSRSFRTISSSACNARSINGNPCAQRGVCRGSCLSVENRWRSRMN